MWEDLAVRKAQPWWAALGMAAAGLIWPAKCLNCGSYRQQGYGWLCQACWEDLILCTGGTGCPLCGKDVSPYALIEDGCTSCLGQRPIWDGLCRSGVYKGVMRELILAFKHGRTELDVLLAGLANAALCVQDWYERIDMFVPVPLHWLRRLQRGYNQAAVIARRLRHPNARFANVLRRTRWTASQTSMPTPKARSRNVAGVFALKGDVKGRTICLVDDVKTTGATLAQCTSALREGGASRVYTLVLAVA
ncbi:MAG: ComF family protein [Sedimentisphaerales bacterium]|nr:ComF family protein [Sedimentisphaerales bacterium]